MVVMRCKSCKRAFSSHGAECPFCEGKAVPLAQTNDFESGRNQAKAVIDSLNTLSSDASFEDGFVEEVVRSHRTLQQSFGRLLIRVIDSLAMEDKKGWYDLRNEATVKMCSKLKEITDNSYLPLV